MHYLQFIVNGKDLSREEVGRNEKFCLSHIKIEISIRYPSGDVYWKSYTNVKLREVSSTEKQYWDSYRN